MKYSFSVWDGRYGTIPKKELDVFREETPHPKDKPPLSIQTLLGMLFLKKSGKKKFTLEDIVLDWDLRE